MGAAPQRGHLQGPSFLGSSLDASLPLSSLDASLPLSSLDASLPLSSLDASLPLSSLDASLRLGASSCLAYRHRGKVNARHLGLTVTQQEPHLGLTVTQQEPHLGLTATQQEPHLGLTVTLQEPHLGLTVTLQEQLLALSGRQLCQVASKDAGMEASQCIQQLVETWVAAGMGLSRGSFEKVEPC
jgi:hypothetical protein